ncbi:hypothetical protein MAR_018323 [Mya arenaria]|uniref:Uncharacterized protein n=1 Tax=Mya arenaria TaxID=6604 RepID=A0ABY7EGX1_MYAAR|nr:hypothetical protein MAR_018323 [Mya arenaria]
MVTVSRKRQSENACIFFYPTGIKHRQQRRLQRRMCFVVGSI